MELKKLLELSGAREISKDSILVPQSMFIQSQQMTQLESVSMNPEQNNNRLFGCFKMKKKMYPTEVVYT